MKRNTANHVWVALFAALVTTGVTSMFYFYGGHDIQVLPAYFIGYVGIAVHELAAPNANVFAVVTVVNFLVYFSIGEAALAVTRRFSR